jgi:hypothetical protein
MPAISAATARSGHAVDVLQTPSGRGESLQIGFGGEVGEVVFSFAGDAALADEPQNGSFRAISREGGPFDLHESDGIVRPVQTFGDGRR